MTMSKVVGGDCLVQSSTAVPPSGVDVCKGSMQQLHDVVIPFATGFNQHRRAVRVCTGSIMGLLEDPLYLADIFPAHGCQQVPLTMGDQWQSYQLNFLRLAKLMPGLLICENNPRAHQLDAEAGKVKNLG
mmetsp:Transcript_69756/g.163226  ORF Transcript_69756/g.163226 Transcript_69756/m.163226 type:complete len:130 (+) Transcript_69756:279-668(+)